MDIKKFILHLMSYSWQLRLPFAILAAATAGSAIALLISEASCNSDDHMSDIVAKDKQVLLPPQMTPSSAQLQSREIDDKDPLSQRLRELDTKVESISRHIVASRTQRLVGFEDTGYSFYYTFQAMLTVGNFGPQSTLGKVLIIIDGFLGMLTFSLFTAAFLAAIRTSVV